MKKKTMPPFRLTAGQSGRLMFHFALPEGATTPMLRGALMVHGESVAMENTLADVLTIPSLPAGVYLSEVRADGVCVLYGHVEVLPSPLSGDAGLATYRIDVDNTTDVLVVNVTLSDDAAMCAQAVTKATQAAELAGGSEVAAARSATAAAASQSKAESAAGAAMDSAAAANARAAEAAAAVEAADARMVAAQDAAAAAEDERETAEAAAAAAGASAAAAAGAAKDAAARAADAATSSQVAAGAASDALEARDAAVRAAEMANARMVAAQDAAADAEDAREGADAAATQALAGAAGAADAASAAAESAIAAAESAALLGDAALKSQNNTFTGKNIFNGAVSGSGTLFGVPLARWMGLSSIFSKVALTPDEFKRMYPEWETAEVWPCMDTSKLKPRLNVNDSPKRGLRYGFFTKSNDSDYIWGTLEEMWLHISGDPYLLVVYLQGLKNYVFAPNLTNAGNHAFEPRITNWSYAPDMTARTVFYAPKLALFRLSGRWDSKREQIHEVTLACNPSPNKKLHFNGAHTIRLVNANFCNCTVVNVVSPVHVEKDSILTILNTLPAYDAATMTTVPTCTMYVDPEYEGDEEIVNALLNLQTSVEEGGKGWTVAVSGISLTAAATYGLRPVVYCKKLADSAGQYAAADGSRWDVSSGTIALRHGEANEQLGYEAFASVEDALEAWGLEAYVPAESGQTME